MTNYDLVCKMCGDDFTCGHPNQPTCGNRCARMYERKI